MKALRIDQFGGPEVMKLVNVPVPEPAAGEVRIKVEACGLNYSDIMIREGTYVDTPSLPYFAGREFCGTVEKVGPGLAGWSEGQRVVGVAQSGAMAEYVVATSDGLIPCPERLTPAQGAAILLAGITAVHCLEDRGRLVPGECVLIHAAAGGVGTLAVQIAKATGALVIGTASNAEKCKVVNELGAAAIDYTKGDWVKEVRSLTGGKGADLILESVGGEVFLRSWKEALAVFGRMVVFGIASREIVSIDNREIPPSNKSITGYHLGAYFPTHLERVVTATMKLVGLIREGKVKPIVGKSFPLEAAVDAFGHMQSRRSIGKVILTP